MFAQLQGGETVAFARVHLVKRRILREGGAAHHDVDDLFQLAGYPQVVSEDSALGGGVQFGGPTAAEAAGKSRADLLKGTEEIAGLMSLLEGHGDVTMDRAGEGYVQGADRFGRVFKMTVWRIGDHSQRGSLTIRRSARNSAR